MKKLLLLFIVGLSAFLPAAAQGHSEFIAPDVIGMTKTDSVEYVSPSGNEYRVFSMASTSLNQFMVWRSNKHGIIMKTADNLRKITVDWSSSNKTAAIALFGSDEPCPGFSELAQDVEWGTFVGELVRGGEKDEDGNEINVQTELIVPEDVDYKYYIVRLPKTTASGSALSMTNIKSFTFNYVPREAAVCAPITVTLPDGEVLGNNNVTLAEPMELSVSCATEGASLSFDFDGLCGLLPANPGVLSINRCGRLVLRAEKEGFEPSERTMQITIPVKPIVMSIGGAAVDEPELRIYGPTDVALSTATPGASLTWTYTTASGTTTGSGESVAVEHDGTLSVTATRDGFTTATRTVTVIALEPLDCIQNVWNTYPLRGGLHDADEFTVLFESTVVYAANVLYDGQVSGQVFITDGTNFARVYFEGREVDFAPGDVIAAGWTSKLCRNGGWKDFTPQSELTVVSHDGVVPEPIVVADADALKPLDPGTPVVVRRATLDKDTSADVYIGDNHGFQIIPKDANGQEILPMVNAFGLPSQPAGTYDIYGLVNFYAYKRTNAPAVGPTDGDYSHLRWRVAPTRYEQWLPTTPRPRFGHSDGAMLAAGTPIEISCQDAEATIMYSLDGGDYAEYSTESRPVMPDHDVTVTAYARKEGQHDSEARSISLRVDPDSGLTQIEADGSASDVHYYDLSGRACAQPLSAGVYIRLSGGRAEKVLVK